MSTHDAWVIEESEVLGKVARNTHPIMQDVDMHINIEDGFVHIGWTEARQRGMSIPVRVMEQLLVPHMEPPLWEEALNASHEETMAYRDALNKAIALLWKCQMINGYVALGKVGLNSKLPYPKSAASAIFKEVEEYLKEVDESSP